MRRMESYVKHLEIQKPVLPFIGNAHLLIGKTSTQLIKEISKYARDTGTPYKSYVGPLLFVGTFWLCANVYGVHEMLFLLSVKFTLLMCKKFFTVIL